MIPLNPEQRLAVEHPGGPRLVIAGAGSGKTRVLTARVAGLLERGLPPEALLAFTFTNRAAREMRDRIEREAGAVGSRLWVGTFHGTAMRLLRREAQAAGIPRDFTIYDREDQEGVLGDVLKALELPEQQYRRSAVLGRISDAKNRLISPEEMAAGAVSPFERRVADAYAAYQAALTASGALDFDDLIACTVRLLERNPAVAERYQRRFEHVLVDEYQDTNHAQFRLVAALAAGHRNLFVVGDDDQSIYGWRGANLANVLEFEQAFPGAEVIRLEQNYRSTRTILHAANAVIANNRSRKGKTLWSERDEGRMLRFILATDEVDEARRVCAVLDARVRAGGRRSDCAVLYRTNAQSRALETELRRSGIAYEIVGGVSFYQRREVKDVVAYLRLVVNPQDAVSFWRVWNTPRRGLGATVEARVVARATETGMSPLAALESLLRDGELTRAAQAGARDLLELVGELRERSLGPADAVILHLFERTRYLEFLGESEDAADRVANVQELVTAAAAFAAGGGGLTEFLGETALVTDGDRVDPASDRVLMLTAHNAKGLEFPAVIIAGLEEGLMPHGNSLDDPSKLEEERRLFYVALTRARDEVTLTAAAYRRRFDGARGGTVSRFVDEIPSQFLERDESAMGSGGSRRGAGGWIGSTRRVVPADADADAGEDASEVPAWGIPAVARKALGRRVYHESFGRGVVVAAEGAGDAIKYTVRFGVGLKKVMARFLSEGADGD